MAFSESAPASVADASRRTHRRRGGVVGRADLLEALQREALDWFDLPGPGDERPGFQRRIAAEPSLEVEPMPAGEGLAPRTVATREPLRMSECWAVAELIRDDAADQGGETAPEPPAAAAPLPRLARAESDHEADRWADNGLRRMWPRRHAELRDRAHPIRSRRKARVDWSEVVRRVARGQALLPLPERRHAHWAANLVLAVDRDSRSMSPLVDDLDSLARRLRRAIGHRAVQVRILQSDYPNALTHWRRPGRHPDQTGALVAWRPLFGETLLLVSDLAAAPRDDQRRAGFGAWLRRMAHGGTDILWFSPVAAPPDVLPPRSRRLPWFGAPQRHLRDDGESPALADLLALVAMVGSVSDLLLRALADLVRPGTPPLDLIWSAWNHPHMRIAGRHCKLTPEAVERYRARLHGLPLTLLQQANASRRRLQAPLPIADEHLASLRMLCLAPATRNLPEAEHAERAALAWLAHELPAQLHDAAPADRARLDADVARYIDLAHPRVHATYRHWFRPLQALVLTDALRRGLPVKTWPELGPVTPDAAPSGQAMRTWKVVRQIDRLRLAPSDAKLPGIVLARDLPAPIQTQVVLESGDRTRWLELGPDGADLADLARAASPIHLRVGRNDVRLARFQRPTWASGWGHTSAGLRVRFATPWATEAELPWPCPPLHRAESSHQGAGFAFGVDDYGLFLDLTLRKVTQRLRWIEPGEFLMGSPDSEPERHSDEGPQHRVRLSEGFWLADSACTQALWLAVRGGKNPSRFNDDPRCPVEQVSWDDVDTFLQRLREHLPASSGPMLPSEAQWEYACRAGTITPFNLGENIVPEQVNYHGYYPYNGAKKGEYRERTVAVKSLTPNACGLYEMHGNVWEWCADDLREYDALPAGEVLRDPLGPTESTSASRALRGGSWFNLARRARSATRRATSRADRNDRFGFRLALMSTSPARPEGA